MIASETLVKGVARGIITADQAERLRALEHAGVPPELPASPDDEQLRFIGGFSDIFVTIGLAMFLGAIGYFGSRSGGPVGMWLAIAAAAWLLAEFFTRLRRMALPSIVLLVVFVAAVFLGASSFLGADAKADIHVRTFVGSFGVDGFEPTMVATAAFVTVLATVLHYWRFRVPITIAAGCCALTGTVVGLAYGLAPELPPLAYNAVIFVCGLAVFALAMRFDTADPARLTRRTDIAFWLHLLASPLIVHSLIKGMVTDSSSSNLSPATAIAIMAVFLTLSFVAVLIDRRALLVSGLVYAGVAFWTLIGQMGLSDMTTPLTLLALGAFVLLLSAGWRPLRAGILSMIPPALTRRLPQPALSV